MGGGAGGAPIPGGCALIMGGGAGGAAGAPYAGGTGDAPGGYAGGGDGGGAGMPGLDIGLIVGGPDPGAPSTRAVPGKGVRGL